MKCQHTLDMTAIDTGSLIRTTDMLEKVFSELQRHEPGVLMHEMCVLAGLKEFEMVLERSGSLLGRRMGSSFASSPGAGWPVFSEVFRQAARHGIISVDTCHRWIEYREVLNVPPHLIVDRFTEGTTSLLPRFIEDARELAKALSAAPAE